MSSAEKWRGELETIRELRAHVVALYQCCDALSEVLGEREMLDDPEERIAQHLGEALAEADAALRAIHARDST